MKQNQEESKRNDEKVEMIDTSSKQQTEDTSSSLVENNQPAAKKDISLFHAGGKTFNNVFTLIIKHFSVQELTRLSGCNKALSAFNPKNTKAKIIKIDLTGYDYFIKNYIENYQQGPDTKAPTMLAYLVPTISRVNSKDNIVNYLGPNYLAQPNGLNFTSMNLGFDKTKSEKRVS